MSNYLDHTNETYRIVKAMLTKVDENQLSVDYDESYADYFSGQRLVLNALLTAMEGYKDYLMDMYELTDEDIWPPLED